MKFQKLFFAAVAAVALASCSDDLTSSNHAGFEGPIDPNYLYVSTANGEVTRASVMQGKTMNIAFEQGDSIKLYDETQNWRPQVWMYDDAATKKYTYNEGVKLFSKPKRVYNEEPQYVNGYGIFPAEIAKFNNEDRTELTIDLDYLKYIEANKVASGDTAYTYKTKMPLWGVANDSRMTLNYLTDFVKVNLSKLPATVDATHFNYLIVRSNSGTNGNNLHNTQAKVKFNPDALTELPTLALTTTGVAKTTINAVTDLDNLVVNQEVAGVADQVKEDIIAIKLDASNIPTAGQKNSLIFVPLIPGDQHVDVFVAANYTEAPTATGTGKKIVSDGNSALYEVVAGGRDLKNDPARTQYFAYNEIGTAVANDINTPQALADRILALDDAFDRDFTLTVNSKVNVKVGSDANGYKMDFKGKALKHNVTVVFGTTYGFAKQAPEVAADGNRLQISNLAASSNTLTLTYATEATSVKVDEILVDSKVLGEVILDGAMYKVVNESKDVLTIKNSVDFLETSGSMAFDKVAATAANVTIKKNGEKNCDKFSLLNGTVTNLKFGTDYDGTVEVYSEGACRILNVNFSTVKQTGEGTAKLFAAKISFTSKLTETSYGYGAATNIIGVNGIDKAIVTALQMLHYDYASADARILATKLDMNGSAGTVWTPIAATLGHKVDGNIAILPSSSTAGAPAVKKAVIKNVKITAADAGLFKQIGTGGVIMNLTLDGVTIASTDQATAGALVSVASDGAAIEKVDVKNITLAPTKVDKVNIIGGVIGKVTATSTAVTLKSVTAAGKVSGYGVLGGLVGFVENNGKVKFGLHNGSGTDRYITDECSSNVELNMTIGNDNDPTYAKMGDFVGAIETPATGAAIDVEINLNSYTPAARTLNAKAQWGTYNTTTAQNAYKAITLNQKLIGISGFYNYNDGTTYGPKRVGSGWYFTVNVNSATKVENKKASTVYNYRATQIASPADTDLLLGTVKDAQ